MTVAIVRTLISDNPRHDRAASTGDGATVEFALPNSPVVTGSARIYVAGALADPSTYTLETDTGLVIFAAAPAASAEVVITYQHTLLSDEEITALLALEGGDDRLAAAQALDILASSEAMVQKKIKVGDLSTDGPAVAAEMRKHAAALRQQSEQAALEAGGGFDIAEMVYDPFSARERLYKEALRDG